ncbi:MAG: YciI family protein [Cellvibrionaceae bacterium]
MFVISLRYIKPLAEVDLYIEGHISYLKKYYANGTFIVSGRKEPRTGGVILAKAENRKTLDEIITEDPFFENGIAKYDITEFIPTMTAQGFDSLKS